MSYEEYICKKVSKLKSNKPFKSGNKINTVKGIIDHPILKIKAFTFYEDDSYVECRRCFLIDREEEMMKKKIILEECKCLSSCCIFNIDYNCTKRLDNIFPTFMFEGLCPSKLTMEDVKR